MTDCLSELIRCLSKLPPKSEAQPIYLWTLCVCTERPHLIHDPSALEPLLPVVQSAVRELFDS